MRAWLAKTGACVIALLLTATLVLPAAPQDKSALLAQIESCIVDYGSRYELASLNGDKEIEQRTQLQVQALVVGAQKAGIISQDYKFPEALQKKTSQQANDWFRGKADGTAILTRIFACDEKFPLGAVQVAAALAAADPAKSGGGLGLPLSTLKPPAQKSALTCAQAVTAWTDGWGTFYPTPAQGVWAREALASASASRAQPSPAWCEGAYTAPRTMPPKNAAACHAIFESDAEKAAGGANAAAAQAKLQAYGPVFTRARTQAGKSTDPASAAAEIKMWRSTYQNWPASLVDAERAQCNAAVADFVPATQWDAMRSGREQIADMCFAVVMSELSAGKWTDIDPADRKWALENEKRPYASMEQPYSACLSRWRPHMTYSRFDISLYETAPLADIIAAVKETKNLAWAAQALSLVNRRTDADSVRAVAALDLQFADKDLQAMSSVDGLVDLPAMDALRALPTPQILKLVAQIRNETWQRSAIALLAARTDLDTQIATGDFLSAARGVAFLGGPSYATDFYRRAADGGSVYGKFRLGQKLIYGTGIARDYAGGKQLISEAASAGNGNAKRELDYLISQERNAADLAEQRRRATEAEAAAAHRMDFILRCGYIPEEEQHKWICAR